MALRGRIAVGLVGVMLALAVAPAATLAQGPSNPLSPGLPESPSTVPTTSATPTVATPQTTTTAGGSGLSGGAAIGIAAGAVVLLAGISYFIWHDARKRAPVKDHAHGDPGVGARSGSKRPPKSRKLSPAERRRRKRGKAR